MKIKTSGKDIVWNYIGTALNLGFSFLLLPFMMRYLDADSLGLWYVFVSIGSIVTILDFGFGPTISRNVAYVWSGARKLKAEDAVISQNDKIDTGLLDVTLKTCRLIDLVIALIALLIELTAGTAYVFDVSAGLDKTVCVASWVIYSIAIYFNLYFGYYYSALCGVGCIAEANVARVIARMMQLVVTIALLFAGTGLIGASIGYLVYGFLYRILLKRAFLKAYMNTIGKIRNTAHIHLKQIRDMFIRFWHNAWRDGLVSLSGYLANQASVLLCSAYMPLAETGTYSISVQIVTALSSIAYAMYNSKQPEMQSAYLTGDKKSLRDSMALSIFFYFGIFAIGYVAVITIGLPILQIIKPETVFSIAIISALAFYELLYKFQTCCASFISNTNRIPYMPAFVISSVAGIILSTIFITVFDLKIWGLILGPIFAQLAYNNWKWPKAVCVEILHSSPYTLFKEGALLACSAVRKITCTKNEKLNP